MDEERFSAGNAVDSCVSPRATCPRPAQHEACITSIALRSRCTARVTSGELLRIRCVPTAMDPGKYAALYYGRSWRDVGFSSSEGLEQLCLEVYSSGGYPRHGVPWHRRAAVREGRFRYLIEEKSITGFTAMEERTQR